MSVEEVTVSNMWEIAALAEWPQGFPPPKYFLRVFRSAPRAAILSHRADVHRLNGKEASS